MAVCHHCGAQRPDNVAFCPSCGTPAGPPPPPPGAPQYQQQPPYPPPGAPQYQQQQPYPPQQPPYPPQQPPYPPPGAPQYQQPYPPQQPYGQPPYPPPGQPQYGMPTVSVQDFKTARLAAMGIDIGVCLGVSIVMSIISMIVMGIAGGVYSYFGVGTWLSVSLINLGVGCYFAIKDSFFGGASIGKRVMKIRVATVDGTAFTLMHSIKRNIGFGVPNLVCGILGFFFVLLVFMGAGSEALLYLLYYVPLSIMNLAALAYWIFELISVLNNPEGQRWGDRFAGTRVVR